MITIPKMSLRQELNQVMTICVGCGCTDLEACANGCAWVAIDENGNGLCTNCARLPIDVLVERARGVFSI